MSEVTYNSDELVPPQFLNDNLVFEILKSAEKDNELKMISHEIKPGSAAGDHYASVMFKIIATYETRGRTVEKRRLIVKTIPESGEKRDFLDNCPVFKNEIRMYAETLPVFEELFQKTGDKPMWPTMLYSQTEPPVLVFEDLTQDNFEMVYKPLSFEDMKLILTKIAKYHAASMVISESTKSDLVTSYEASFSAEDMRAQMVVLIRQAKDMGVSIQSWPGDQMAKIGSKIEKNIEKIYDNFADKYSIPNTWGYNVLNHGDFHIRNMMFKKDAEGRLQDVTFLDFQIPIWSSPGHDLNYMWSAIGSAEVRLRRFEAINFYHSELVKALAAFGFSGNVPSAVDVNVEILRMAGFEAFQAVSFMSFMNIDLSGIQLTEVFTKDEGKSPIDGALKTLYQDPYFIETTSKTLIYLDSLGLFD